MEKSIKIVDATLREGCLKYGLTVAQYYEIASLLTSLPIDMFEVCCNYKSNKYDKLIREMVNVKTKCPIIAAVDMNPLSIDKVISLGIAWIGLSFRIEDLKMQS